MELEAVIPKKLAKGYVRAGVGAAKKATPKKAATKKTSAKSGALRELVAILAPKDAKVAQQVALACDDPDAYAKDFKRALSADD